MNSGSVLTLTIPQRIKTGFNCLIVQKGAGKVQIQHAGGTDYIKNRSSEVYTAGQYAVVSIICIGGDLFIISGDTSGS